MFVTDVLTGKSCGVNRRRRQRGRSLESFMAQALESRLVLAGNVIATFSLASGQLTFTGDAANNEITINVDGVGDAIATGNGGTTINGMASLNISDFTMDVLSSVVVNGGDGADVTNLSTAVNSIFFPGPVTINGNNGNDTVNVGSANGQSVSFGSLTITGGNDNDVISFASALFVASPVVLQGNAGNDTYSFDTDNSLGSVLIQENVGAGIDTLTFSKTSTRAVAVNLSSAAAQVVNAGLTLTLSAGNTFENVIGGTLGDALTGNGLANTLTGNKGNDLLTGAAGNDTYVFDTDLALGSDTINEAGGGVDTLNFSTTTTRAVSVNLSNAAAQVVNTGLTLTLSANNTIENVIGGSLGDTLTGNTLANVLAGGAGDDNLNGGTGKDILIGGIGADLLTGGSGENLLLGARYTSEANATALIALRSEWTSASSYSNRVAHLRGTLAGGFNGSYKLTSATVKEDNAKDTLKGSSGKDWYLRNRLGATVANRDAVTDVDLDSVFTEISSWL